MTDNEIIKALECCIKAKYHGDCEDMKCPACKKEGCLYFIRADGWNDGSVEHYKDALDIINRQRAEIEDKAERLRKVLPIVAELKAEAIKEFLESAKSKAHYSEDFGEACVSCHDLDKVAEEMIGEQNDD